jgi:hypothetical protein
VLAAILYGLVFTLANIIVGVITLTIRHFGEGIQTPSLARRLHADPGDAGLFDARRHRGVHFAQGRNGASGTADPWHHHDGAVHRPGAVHRYFSSSFQSRVSLAGQLAAWARAAGGRASESSSPLPHPDCNGHGQIQREATLVSNCKTHCARTQFQIANLQSATCNLYI